MTDVERDYCAACGEVIYEDPHTGAEAVYADDIRQLWCGEYAHKDCQKDGDRCRIHGRPPPRPVDAT